MKVHSTYKYLCVYCTANNPATQLETIISSRVELSDLSLAEKFYGYYSIKVFRLVSTSPYGFKHFNGRQKT